MMLLSKGMRSVLVTGGGPETSSRDPDRLQSPGSGHNLSPDFAPCQSPVLSRCLTVAQCTLLSGTFRHDGKLW